MSRCGPTSASLLTCCCRTGKKADHTAAYFSYQNDQAMQLREQLAEESLDMLIQWLKDGGNVGIHGTDAFVSAVPKLILAKMQPTAHG